MNKLTSYIALLVIVEIRFNLLRIARRLSMMTVSSPRRVLVKEITEQYTEPSCAVVVAKDLRWYDRIVVLGGKYENTLKIY